MLAAGLPEYLDLGGGGGSPLFAKPTRAPGPILRRHNLPTPHLALWPTEVHVVMRGKVCEKGCYFWVPKPPWWQHAKARCVFQIYAIICISGNTQIFKIKTFNHQNIVLFYI